MPKPAGRPCIVAKAAHLQRLKPVSAPSAAGRADVGERSRSTAGGAASRHSKRPAGTPRFRRRYTVALRGVPNGPAIVTVTDVFALSAGEARRRAMKKAAILGPGYVWEAVS